MSSEWKSTSLGELTDLAGGTAYKSADFKDFGVPVLKTKNVKTNHLNFDDLSYVPKKTAQKYKNVAAEKDDLLITMTGNRYGTNQDTWVGKVAFFDREEQYFINQRVGRLRVKDNQQIDPRYLAYCLSSYDYQLLFISTATGGGGQANLSPDQIYSVQVPLPSLSTQKKISEVLGTLDDKLALNRQISQSLEGIAQAIFKSWFVDFDPVRAKVAAMEEGRDPLRAAMCAISGKRDEELDALPRERLEALKATAALFPEGLEASELGEIPEGWQYRQAQSLAEIAIGKTPPRKEPKWFSTNPDDFVWVSIKDLGAGGIYIWNSSEYLVEEAINEKNVRVVPDNTVLLSFKLTVGRVAITVGEVTTNEAIAHFKLDEDAHITTEYLYSYLKQFDYLLLGSTSSIATAVNSKTIKSMPILYPSFDLIRAFTDACVPGFSEIKNRAFENSALATLRDTLLPKLLSGELSVAAADELVGEVVVG